MSVASKQLVAAGRILAASGNVDAARKLFERALTTDPDDLDALEALASFEQGGIGIVDDVRLDEDSERQVKEPGYQTRETIVQHTRETSSPFEAALKEQAAKKTPVDDTIDDEDVSVDLDFGESEVHSEATVERAIPVSATVGGDWMAGSKSDPFGDGADESDFGDESVDVDLGGEAAAEGDDDWSDVMDERTPAIPAGNPPEGLTALTGWGSLPPPPQEEESRLLSVPAPTPPEVEQASLAQEGPLARIAHSPQVLSSEGRPASSVQAVPDPVDPIEQMLQRARACMDLDDQTHARELLENAIRVAPSRPDVLAMFARNEQKLLSMYAAKLGNMKAVLKVRVAEDELIWLSLDHRAGFMLSQVDGRLTAEELVSISGMSRLDALRTMMELIDKRTVDVILPTASS